MSMEYKAGPLPFDKFWYNHLAADEDNVIASENVLVFHISKTP